MIVRVCVRACVCVCVETLYLHVCVYRVLVETVALEIGNVAQKEHHLETVKKTMLRKPVKKIMWSHTPRDTHLHTHDCTHTYIQQQSML